MSPREKKLLIFFGSAGFIVLNFLAFAQYQAKRLEFDRSLEEARRQLETAKMFSASRELVTDQMDWLASHEPQPADKQVVQTNLDKLCETEAKNAGLEVTSQKPLETDTTSGTHYHRAKVQFTVSGREEDLYRWFDRLNVPDQLRAATFIRLSPNKDDTKIDCTAIVEQWFVPVPAA